MPYITNISKQISKKGVDSPPSPAGQALLAHPKDTLPSPISCFLGREGGGDGAGTGTPTKVSWDALSVNSQESHHGSGPFTVHPTHPLSPHLNLSQVGFGSKFSSGEGGHSKVIGYWKGVGVLQRLTHSCKDPLSSASQGMGQVGTVK